MTQEEDERPLKRSKNSFENCYAGCRLQPPSDNAFECQIDTVQWKEIKDDPKHFYHVYIQKRKPAKIQGALNDQDCDLRTICKLRDVDYLKNGAAADKKVHVEKRAHGKAKFGRARHEGEVVMTFGEFLSIPQPDRHLYYLTTQPIQTDEEGRPNLMSQPVLELQDDFPSRPRLAGNLIPMNYNLWMGSSNIGSTSGLHHDYHDNFYILLSGRKQFTLYSPDQAQVMNTRGIIDKVFENGLIHYQGEPEVNVDGIELASLKAFEADLEKQRCVQALAEAEAAVQQQTNNKEDGGASAQQRVQEAEAALEDALDKVLAVEMEQQDDEESNCEEDGNNKTENGGDDEDDCFWSNVSKSKSAKTAGRHQDEDIEDQLMGDDEQEDDDDDSDTSPPIEKMLNFSQIESPDPVPGIPYAQVVLEQGDLLYLPAGWFHNVTSYSTNNDSDGGWHVAFNYWFHPPSGHFDNPYSTQFWQSDWQERMEEKEP